MSCFLRVHVSQCQQVVECLPAIVFIYAQTHCSVHNTQVPEIIDPVFAKTSQNARFLLSENERFGLVFVKTGSINSGKGDAHSSEDPTYIFLEMRRVRGLVPHYYIHASVSDLYIPRIGLGIWLHECGNWKTEQ
jgi:hypothetical protein